MDRRPEHLMEDSHLRPEFVGQESVDEYMARVAPWLGNTGAGKDLEEAGYTEDDVRATLREEWRTNLNDDTNIVEFYYLMGYTNKLQRDAAIDQSHAELVDAMVAQGLIPERQFEEELKGYESG